MATTNKNEIDPALELWVRNKLGYSFKNPAVLCLAVTHRSIARDNNERLEFLGDAVLDTVISERLLSALPTATEGELSRQRAALVREQSLAGIAADLELGSHLVLGSGERKSGGHRRKSILADALEAILGAVFMDGGYASVEVVVDRLFQDRLAKLPRDIDLKDPKTRLQEWLQERSLMTPEYEVVSVSGKPHEQKFEVSCVVAEKSLKVTASGTSRRKAEQAAASRALDELVA